MFKDTKEELQRLENQLLEELEPTQQIPEISDLPEITDAMLYGTEESVTADPPPVAIPAEHPGAYVNFANGYGRNTIYNSDYTELEPEELSEDLLDEEEVEDDACTGLWIAVFALLIANLGVLLFWGLRLTGVLG